MSMRRLSVLLALIITYLPVSALAEADKTYLRLIDNLDRPQDGYCIDVVGSGPAMRPDLPLTTHNCKTGYFADEAVNLRADGTLYFPFLDGCVTAMGLNQYAVAGSPLMLRVCGEESPFLTASNFQTFDLRADGTVALRGFDLCLEAGPQSAPTFSPDHRFRALALASCEEADPARSRWFFDVRE